MTCRYFHGSYRQDLQACGLEFTDICVQMQRMLAELLSMRIQVGGELMSASYCNMPQVY